MHLYDIDCPKCGIKCWVNDGDVSDLTMPDVEALRCWHCHHEFLIDDDHDSNELFVGDTYMSASEASDANKG